MCNCCTAGVDRRALACALKEAEAAAANAKTAAKAAEKAAARAESLACAAREAAKTAESAAAHAEKAACAAEEALEKVRELIDDYLTNAGRGCCCHVQTVSDCCPQTASVFSYDTCSSSCERPCPCN